MGLFDEFLNLSRKSPFVCDEDPQGEVKRILKDISRERRREVEEKAESMHPLFGTIVKITNNINDTLENVQDSMENGLFRELFSPEVKELNLADHLFVQRFGYTHHGLYIGNGMVIHYLAEKVKQDTLEIFSDGAKIHKKSDRESPITYSRQTAVNRAYKRLYEDRYNLIINNCDSFVRWCRNGASN